MIIVNDPYYTVDDTNLIFDLVYMKIYFSNILSYDEILSFIYVTSTMLDYKPTSEKIDIVIKRLLTLSFIHEIRYMDGNKEYEITQIGKKYFNIFKPKKYKVLKKLVKSN